MASGGDSQAHWRALRDAGDIQFSPLPPPPPEAPSRLGQWLEQFFTWLGQLLKPLFEPVGQALGLGWPVMRIVLVVVAIALVLVVLARALLPLWRKWRERKVGAPAPDWAPGQEAARALLADADRLASEGRFAEAVHVLLERSVGQIALARPEWLQPASTAREIAGLAGLSAGAREAFGAISARVEASRFALRALGEADWVAAREAYARFAGVPLAGER